MQVERKVYTFGEVRRMLGISQNTLYRWVREKKIPFIRIGRNYKFPCQAIDEMLQ